MLRMWVSTVRALSVSSSQIAMLERPRATRRRISRSRSVRSPSEGVSGTTERGALHGTPAACLCDERCSVAAAATRTVSATSAGSSHGGKCPTSGSVTWRADGRPARARADCGRVSSSRSCSPRRPSPGRAANDRRAAPVDGVARCGQEAPSALEPGEGVDVDGRRDAVAVLDVLARTRARRTNPMRPGPRIGLPAERRRPRRNRSDTCRNAWSQPAPKPTGDRPHAVSAATVERQLQRDPAAQRVPGRVEALVARPQAMNAAQASVSARMVGGPSSGGESPNPGRSTAKTSNSPERRAVTASNARCVMPDAVGQQQRWTRSPPGRDSAPAEEYGSRMRVGVPSEIKTDEYRVALTPAGVRELVEHGHEVLVQRAPARARRSRTPSTPRRARGSSPTPTRSSPRPTWSSRSRSRSPSRSRCCARARRSSPTCTSRRTRS